MFYNGMKEVLSWFGTNLMDSFKVLHKLSFLYFGKNLTSCPSDLEISYLNLQLAIDLYREHAKCPMCNMLLSLAPYKALPAIS